ncbi:MAG: DUF1638 domain-containing protein [Chloroflexota bacterium]|jgi:hypothetical protein
MSEAAKPDKRPVVVIACQVLQDLLARLLPESLADEVTFMDYGLHRVPNRMTGALQDAINSIEQPSLIVLGYGLCGNGLKGLKAGIHTLLVPRADDCIAILLGSRESYMREFEAHPGTYYLSKGWLESGSHPLKEYEEYVEKYGSDDADWVMDMQYQHYERLVLVTHNEEDMEAYRPQALEVAQFCQRWDMRYEEIQGSDGYVRRLIKAASLNNDLTPEKAGNDFLVIPPGGEIRQYDFI